MRWKDVKVSPSAVPETIPEVAIPALSAVVTLATLGWMLWFSHYGFDFTDEGSYLVWISNPWNYKVSATQYGFVYHPLYELFDGDIATLRQANILITFCLAWVLCMAFIRVVFTTGDFHPRYSIRFGNLATSAAFAASSLILFIVWLPTPSYNSLALQALLVAGTGLLLAEKYVSGTSLFGWVLIGVAGWAAFMAKPTTAAALGIAAGVYLLLAGKLKARLLAISLLTAVALVGVTAWSIDGSVPGFMDRIQGGEEMARTLGGGQTLNQALRLDNYRMSRWYKALLACGTLAVTTTVLLSLSRKNILTISGTALSAVFAIASLAVVSGIYNPKIHSSDFRGLLIWAVPFAAIGTSVFLSVTRGYPRTSRTRWALALCLLVFPHIYACGSNRNYWQAGSGAGIFWVLAGLVVLAPSVSGTNLLRTLLPLGFGAQLITVVLIHSGMEAPQRQPQPLRMNDFEAGIGKHSSRLVLSRGYGTYIGEAAGMARHAGFREGTPMVDMTGQSPGILYAMGASSVGQAWTIGGYPGSDNLAVAMLKRVPCDELAGAWVLVEPDGPRKLSPEVLASFGANMSSDYEVVATLDTPVGAGGYDYARTQRLLRPLRSPEDAKSACELHRMQSR